MAWLVVCWLPVLFLCAGLPKYTRREWEQSSEQSRRDVLLAQQRLRAIQFELTLYTVADHAREELRWGAAAIR